MNELLLIVAFILFIVAGIARFQGAERWTALGWIGLAAVTLAALT